jgi:hypothetical protein
MLLLIFFKVFNNIDPGRNISLSTQQTSECWVQKLDEQHPSLLWLVESVCQEKQHRFAAAILTLRDRRPNIIRSA